MKLKDIDIKLLLPGFMQADAADRGIADGLSAIIRDVSTQAKRITAWDQIDKLPASELDALAVDLGIAWYSPGADIAAKRATIKASEVVHLTLATKYAVENVISTYFGDGFIEEWFEYGGEPYHFKVVTTNPLLATTKQAEFLRILGIVKRKSMVLDAIEVGLSGDVTAHMGAGYYETAKDNIIFPAP